MLGYRDEEQLRLQRQAYQLATESKWLFDQIPLKRGGKVVEIGCGPHGCLDMLAERVGASGLVIGVERSDESVGLARAMARERGLGNVEVVHRDARNTGLPRNTFDLVTLRLVLVNVPQPEEIVREAMSLVRPGGWIALHEADYLSFVCDPPSEAWERYMQLFSGYSEKNGIDPYIGRKLPRLLREITGIQKIMVNPLIHVYPPDHERRYLAHDFAENLSDRLVAELPISKDEYESLKLALRQHIADPNTLVVSHLFFQVWGQKPIKSECINNESNS
ncbi:SAM-dependent methyltransferase [Burkholderia sp. ABCPW 11]|nr:SAM-dependent methyltransferase [Burkholderia sp. ABCPW 11]